MDGNNGTKMLWLSLACLLAALMAAAGCTAQADMAHEVEVEPPARTAGAEREKPPRSGLVISDGRAHSDAHMPFDGRTRSDGHFPSDGQMLSDAKPDEGRDKGREHPEDGAPDGEGSENMPKPPEDMGGKPEGMPEPPDGMSEKPEGMPEPPDGMSEKPEGMPEPPGGMGERPEGMPGGPGGMPGAMPPPDAQ